MSLSRIAPDSSSWIVPYEIIQNWFIDKVYYNKAQPNVSNIYSPQEDSLKVAINNKVGLFSTYLPFLGYVLTYELH